jgi:hypothetical protein
MLIGVQSGATQFMGTTAFEIEARSLKMLTTALQANFSRRPDKIVVFDRSTNCGKWHLARK